MNAGIRSKARRTWPRGLEEVRPGYFRWMPPADVRHLIERPIPAGGFVIGKVSLKEAIAQVVAAFAEIEGSASRQSLVDKIIGKPETVAEWIPIYLAAVEKRVSSNTCANIRRMLARIPESVAHAPVAAVTTRQIADWLDTIAAPTMRGAIRSKLQDMFRDAIAAGWRADNPVTVTRAPHVETQRGRLSLDAYLEIHAWSEANQRPWATRALELALVTAHRREDVAQLQFSQAHDGALWVIQHKTGAKVCTPLDLRLNAVGWSVGEVVARCRNGVVSRYMIHHSVHHGTCKPGDRIVPRTLSDAFAAARDAVGVTVAGKTPPTLHEIRSLSLRLYHEQGVDAQAIAGHKDASMTAVYRDVRGDEWIRVTEK